MANSDFTLTQECLLRVFEYKDGVLYWKNPIRIGRVKPGDKAGRIVTDGHLQTCVAKNRLYNHRIIFMMFHGYMPEQVDHIDCNPLNNKIENLRAVTNQQNIQNRRIFKKNKSGVKGVYLTKNGKKWRAFCTKDGVQHSMGVFDSIVDAEKAVKLFREHHHGEFARHN